jgi:hypothetical protein
MSKEDAPGQNKSYQIIINGRRKTFDGKKITFSKLINLAFGESPQPNVAYTITYKRGVSDNSEGDLVEGDDVRVKEGMVFNVTPTDKS